MIKIEGLKKRFGELTAVDDLNFDISRNEIFGLLGPNGAGKTTTISMICGLLSPSEGQIIFEEYDGKDRKSLIGYCPQENIYYPRLTCIEQLLFIGHLYGLSSKYVRSRAEEILDLLGLKGKSSVLASNLSGGMKRRLNICLAIIHDPEILILDEPEAGLDPQSRIMVRDFIKAFASKKTIVLTTHNMDEADRMADRVAIIDHGKLLMLNTPQKLKNTVGEGDILELVLENSNETAIKQFSGMVSSLSMNVKIRSGSVLIKYPNILENLPAIKDMTETAGLTVSEIKLRENTLEDVFIHLTGRNLRQ